MSLRLLALPLALSLTGPFDDEVSVEGPSDATSSLLTPAQASLSSTCLHPSTGSSYSRLPTLPPYCVLSPPLTPPALSKNTCVRAGTEPLARSQGTEEVHQEAREATEVMCLREKKWLTKNTKSSSWRQRWAMACEQAWLTPTPPRTAFSDGGGAGTTAASLLLLCLSFLWKHNLIVN